MLRVASLLNDADVRSTFIMRDHQVAEKILSLAKSRKAAAAEVFLRFSTSTTIEVKDQKIEAFERARDQGAGLRVLVGDRPGFAFTTDFSDAALATLAQAAVTNATNSEPDSYQSLPGGPPAPYPVVTVHDPAMITLPDDEKISRTMAMEREAFGIDKRIKRIRKASTGFSESETVILNSSGAGVAYQSTACSASIEVVAEEQGESQAGWDYEAKRFYRQLSPEEVGRRAARKALDLLGARSITSVKAPVILDSTVAEEFLSIMASGFSAENVQKGKSLLAGKLEQMVVSPALTLLDDGLREGGLGTAPADDEAVPLRTKTLIDQGRLVMFLHNTYTANKDKTVSTGNGVRGGFKSVPGVGVTNLYLVPGKQTPEELIADTGKGLYVTEIMGAHTANPISGDFSVGATGFWIENGKKAYPVREIAIAGNILDLMKNVDVVAADLRFSGRIGSPTLRIKELSIGGT